MNCDLFDRLFIHATNVHQGGGRSLLNALFRGIPGSIRSIATIDSRMVLPKDLLERMEIRRIKPTLLHRFNAELWITKNVTPKDVVLCFGNLPPLFKLRGHTVVFVQNRYLVDNVKLDGFSLKTRLRIAVERLWLSCRMANANEFVVQTPTMKRLLDARTKGITSVRVLPFVANHNGIVQRARSSEVQKEKDFDFLYVASGESHKNHRQLIEAWCLLAQDGLLPSLKLTLNRSIFPDLCSFIGQKTEQFHLNVENLGHVPHDKVEQLYCRSGALIYPSIFESFGLPMVEARQAGLPVLAPELDYVRDVLDPEQTFDPESAVSIARAVKRFLKLEEQPLPLQDAVGFIKSVLKSVE